MKFRKKPVIVEAWPVLELCTAATANWKALPSPIAAAYEQGKVIFLSGNNMEVMTLNGFVRAGPTEWIIRGVQGELYPCTDDILKATYEPAGDAP